MRWDYFFQQNCVLVAGRISQPISSTDNNLANFNVEAFYKAFMANTHDAIISHDLEGKITSWNSGAELIFGSMHDEVIGQPIKSVIFEAEKNFDQLLEKIKSKMAVAASNIDCVRKDGQKLKLEVTCSPIVDQSDNVLGSIMFATNISKTQESEDKLTSLTQELQRTYRIMVNREIKMAELKKELRKIKEKTQ